MSVIPLHATTRWEPDDHLIDAAMSGRVRGADLDEHTRAWLVATLTARGDTTDTIAAWLRCSRRTVQTVRLEAVAVLTTRLIAAEKAAEKAIARTKATASVPGLTDLVRERDRLRDQRGQLIDQLAAARAQASTECPPQIVILKPTGRPRRPRPTDTTLPLFPIGETA